MIPLSNISKKEKMGLAVASAIVLLALVDRLIAVPISAKFKKTNAEIKANEIELAVGLRNLGQKDDITRDYGKYIQYIKSNYSEGEETSKLLEEIENLGRNSDISINDVKPQPPKQSGSYRDYLIEIEAQGRMDALMNFLYKLASSKQLFRVNKIHIAMKDKVGSIVKASILVTKSVLP